ncbi:hypothetical protein SLEP1_g9681 [Rubroshorea leprosula]|uniref:BHLH domain-containing protein n=1 Tax=Rubroshorea leprosula TaxID=152421 RepID=A0AAV5IEY0_9ROSI|nr:hypothetical protein SLEP1_g9681 [Rubroshorea leprosula]
MEEKEKGKTTSSSTKVERKVIEKNRRDQMKHLYSSLNSLLPHQPSKKPLTVPDQIDEAVDYIKSMQKRLKECEERREELTGRKRVRGCSNIYGSDAAGSSSKSAEIKIHEMGSDLQIFLITGLENKFIFYDIIRILHEQGAEVENATYSTWGDKIFHVLHAKNGGVGGEKITEILNKFVYGSTNTEEEPSNDLWEYWDSLEL